MEKMEGGVDIFKWILSEEDFENLKTKKKKKSENRSFSQMEIR